jgi:DNA-3-methyladenine glycosylase
MASGSPDPAVHRSPFTIHQRDRRTLGASMDNEALRRVLEEDVVEGAKALLGATLIRGEMRARIVETEAYRGEDDAACHAFGKARMKNMAMFGPAGRSYVYFTYGNHWMLNVAAHPEGRPAAVLVRAAVPLEGLAQMRLNRPRIVRDEDLLSGPGKLCQAMEIGAAENDLELLGDPASPLRIEAGERVENVGVGVRIGIAVGKAHDWPWRFVDADAMHWISRPLRSAARGG